MDIAAPYDPGSPGPIATGGDPDPGGRDPVAGDVAGAVAAAHARLGELQSDTYGQGSVIGDLLDLPRGYLDPGVGSLGTPEPPAGATPQGEAGVYDFDSDSG